MDRAEAIKELMPFTLCDVYSDNLREACRMAIAALREQGQSRCHDPMTNADRIRAMTDEELAEWLADMFDCHYCSEHERLGDNPLLSAEQCDQKCEQHCLDWLKQPCGGADHE